MQIKNILNNTVVGQISRETVLGFPTQVVTMLKRLETEIKGRGEACLLLLVEIN